MWFYILAAVIGFVGASYLYVRQKWSYFRSKGITEEPGTITIKLFSVSYRSKNYGKIVWLLMSFQLDISVKVTND